MEHYLNGGPMAIGAPGDECSVLRTGRKVVGAQCDPGEDALTKVWESDSVRNGLGAAGTAEMKHRFSLDLISLLP